MIQFVLEQGILLGQLRVEHHTARITLLQQFDHMLLAMQLGLLDAEGIAKILQLFVLGGQLIGYLLKRFGE